MPSKMATAMPVDVEEFDKETFCLEPEKVLHSIKFRRSIRKYKPDKVKKESLEMLLQAGRYTATDKNNQDSCFVFVQNELEQLKTMVWDFIDNMEKQEGRHIARELLAYVSFNRRRKADAEDDYLFRNAPVVLYITSDWPLDAGLAAQTIETMAVSMGMGALYNGYLARITDANPEAKKGLESKAKQLRPVCFWAIPPELTHEPHPEKAQM